eukprot:6191421-Pleurochrysis_carterae.AAC.2
MDYCSKQQRTHTSFRMISPGRSGCGGTSNHCSAAMREACSLLHRETALKGAGVLEAVPMALIDSQLTAATSCTRRRNAKGSVSRALDSVALA